MTGIDGIIEAVKEIFGILWSPVLPLTSKHHYIRARWLERGIHANIGLLYQVVDIFIALANAESRPACLGSIAKLDEEMWTGILKNKHIFPPYKPFIRRMFYYIQDGATIPFLALYFSSTREAFDHEEMYRNSDPQQNSSQCMHFILTSTLQLIIFQT